MPADSSLKEKTSSNIVPIAAILFFSILIYLPTLQNGFVFDDDLTVGNNSFITSFINLPGLFNNKDYFLSSGELSYRPVTTLTYFMDYFIFKYDAWGYHLTNILLHTLNGILLYLFLILLFNNMQKQRPAENYMVSALSCFLFIAHPVLTETTNAVSFREDLLVFLFYITALNLYLLFRHKSKHPRTIYYIASLFAFFLALLSKEMALTLPLILCSYEVIYKRTTASVRYIIGYIIVSLFYLYLRFYHFYNPSEKETFIAWHISERFFTVPYLIVNYMRLSFFPVSLSAEYSIVPISTLFSSSFIVPGIILIIMYSLALMNKKKEAIFGIIFFMITLIPALNIYPLGNPFAERYLYLPVAGFIIISGVMIASCEGLKNRYLSLSLIVLISGIYTISAVSRHGVWRDSYTLWTDTLSKKPDSVRAHNNLALFYANQGMFDSAIYHYETALKLKNDDWHAHDNMGNLYTVLGRYDEAIQHFQSAIKFNPNGNTYNNLGFVYLRIGKIEEAIEEFRNALKLSPRLIKAYNNLGNAYLRKGMKKEAKAQFEMVLTMQPDNRSALQAIGSLKWEGLPATD